ncbi:MAG TPA: CRISPR-associated helicase Cas3', partial [Niabella sp.]|nr:CRISPR-associated helicase Cas3' [Niabella sp.]
CFRNHHCYKEAILRHYEMAGVRTYLQLADKRASAKEENNTTVGFNKFSYTFPEDWQKRNVQIIAEQYSNDELLLMRAPTGAGKTDAALLWAFKQIEHKRAERLVIAMPTRFTSNALSINVAESLSSTGLYHSSAWFNRYHKGIKSGEVNKELAQKEHELARQLSTPVTVCTIDHLLVALTLTREDHHTITFNLANSCVVIDEADFYDEFTQANILVLLEGLKVLNVPVMIMSASLPESSIEMYKQTGYQIESIREDTSDNNRIRCKIEETRKYESLGEIEDLLQKCIQEKRAIIYANTVAKAIEFYHWFEKKGVKPILYHSRFTEPDKKLKEQMLLGALGKDAWERGTAKGIAILTQIGEMSVNISAEVMISEVCPMDRLVQRAGRLCRFDKNKIGKLYVVVPNQNDALYPAPYGKYIPRQGWEANQALVKTIELLETREYSASDFVQLINKVYPSFNDFSVKTKENADLLKSKFVSNWIILPLEQSKEDDTDNQDWKSRDIIGNETVFVTVPDVDSFYFWQDFQEFKLENSIDIASYLIVNGIKNNRIIQKEIKVVEETMTIYVALNAYNFDFGLQLSENSVDDQFL